MSVFKCKMCGGDLNVHEGDKIVTCEFCDTTQTIIASNDEKIIKQINRGNMLRNIGEFDKAYNIFENIISENSKSAEIYWNLLLCKYGIIYVKDYDGSMKPTINRMSMTSIIEDEDYKKVISLSDVVSRGKYIEETKEIARIQDGVLEVIKKEEPYDIFISYKETDEYGDRTNDSVIAQDMYDTLTKEGYKVFLSRITLSSLAGRDYETYIYQALYTSKAMILIATNEEYINSVWVKNEWSRFVSMMRNDSTKTLIPCYKEISPYDLPRELRNLQGIDMSKLGFLQDLKIGIDKIFDRRNYGLKRDQMNFNEVCNNLTLKAWDEFENGKFAKTYNLLDQIFTYDKEYIDANILLYLINILNYFSTTQIIQGYNMSLQELKEQFDDKLLKGKNENILKQFHENLYKIFDTSIKCDFKEACNVNFNKMYPLIFTNDPIIKTWFNKNEIENLKQKYLKILKVEKDDIIDGYIYNPISGIKNSEKYKVKLHKIPLIEVYDFDKDGTEKVDYYFYESKETYCALKDFKFFSEFAYMPLYIKDLNPEIFPVLSKAHNFIYSGYNINCYFSLDGEHPLIDDKTYRNDFGRVFKHMGNRYYLLQSYRKNRRLVIYSLIVVFIIMILVSILTLIFII